MLTCVGIPGTGRERIQKDIHKHGFFLAQLPVGEYCFRPSGESLVVVLPASVGKLVYSNRRKMVKIRSWKEKHVRIAKRKWRKKHEDTISNNGGNPTHCGSG